MSNRRPWPEWASYEHKTIMIATKKIKTMVQSCIEEGLNGWHNVYVLERAMPFLEVQAQNIKLACATARAKRPDGLRWPRWVLPLLDQAPSEADFIIECITLADNLFQKQNYDGVGIALKHANQAALKIEAMLSGVEISELKTRT